VRRADRLFRLVQLLRSRRFATAETLAALLEVSVRTIYRDVRDLSASGVPIIGEAGVGYTLARNAQLPPVSFDTEEIDALVTGARLVEAVADPELAAAARSALAKLEAVLPEALRAALVATPLHAVRLPRNDAASAGLDTLRRAIASQRRVEFGYTWEDGTESARSVRPLGLYFWGRSWSLTAWCELRRDYRNFRPDRMRDVKLGSPFPEDATISLDNFLVRMRAEHGL
jgi:predicted DNA-binding transcriptional regulator YafY